MQALDNMVIKDLEVILKQHHLPTSALSKAARIQRILDHEFVGDTNSTQDLFTDEEIRILVNSVHECKLQESCRDKKDKTKRWTQVQQQVRTSRNCLWPIDKLQVHMCDAIRTCASDLNRFVTTITNTYRRSGQICFRSTSKLLMPRMCQGPQHLCGDSLT